MQIMLTLQRRGGILKNLCNKKTEVYSRVVGYYRPVQNWNLGKKEEYRMRKTFKQDIDLFTIEKNNIVFKEGSKCKYNLINYEFVEIFELGSFAFFDDKTGQNEVAREHFKKIGKSDSFYSSDARKIKRGIKAN